MIHLKSGFYVAVGVFSNRSQMMSKCDHNNNWDIWSIFFCFLSKRIATQQTLITLLLTSFPPPPALHLHFLLTSQEVWGGSRNKLSIHEWGRGALAQVSTGTRVIYCYIKFDGKKPLNKNPERLDSRTKEQQDIFICKISWTMSTYDLIDGQLENFTTNWVPLCESFY